MRGKRISGLVLACLSAVFCCLCLAQGEEQRVVVQNWTPTPEGRLAFDAVYTATDSARLTGLGLRLHFDSSRLKFLGLEDVLEEGFVAQSRPQLDRADYDRDPRTDRYVLIGWTDLYGNWPSEAATTLFTARFERLGETGRGTPVRFSAASTAAGYRFTSEVLEFEIPAKAERSDVPRRKPW